MFNRLRRQIQRERDRQRQRQRQRAVARQSAAVRKSSAAKARAASATASAVSAALAAAAAQAATLKINGQTVNPPPEVQTLQYVLTTDIPNYDNYAANGAAKAYRSFAINNKSHLKETTDKLSASNAAVSELQGRPIDNTGLSYNNLIKQNKLIDKQIQENKDVFSTDSQKIIHQSTNIQLFKHINFYLMILYYICVLGLLLFLYFKPTNYSLYFKIFIVFFFLFLPFIQILVEEYVYYYGMKLWSIVNFNVYSHKDY